MRHVASAMLICIAAMPGWALGDNATRTATVTISLKVYIAPIERDRERQAIHQCREREQSICPAVARHVIRKVNADGSRVVVEPI